MSRMAAAVSIALLAVSVIEAQNAPFPKFYKTYEEYCYHTPDAPTCRDGKPLKVDTSKLFEAIDRTKMPAVPSASQLRSAPVSRPASVRAVPRGTPSAKPVEIRLGELDWRLVPPGSDMLIGMNLAGLVESELARTLIAGWAEKLGATTAEQQKMLGVIGNIAQGVVSIRGREMLAIIVGRADDVPEVSAAQGMAMLRVSPDTVIMGSNDAVAAANRRLRIPGGAAPRLSEARRLAATTHFWVWGRPQAFAALAGGGAGNLPVTKLSMGVNFTDGFRMDMVLEASDGVSAARLAQASSKGSPRGMQTTVEGNSVHFALALDRDTALQRFSGFMTDSFGKQFAPLLAAARQMSGRPGAAARPTTGKIVIDGLDDGPREVPAGPKP